MQKQLLDLSKKCVAPKSFYLINSQTAVIPPRKCFNGGSFYFNTFYSLQDLIFVILPKTTIVRFRTVWIQLQEKGGSKKRELQQTRMKNEYRVLKVKDVFIPKFVLIGYSIFHGNILYIFLCATDFLCLDIKMKKLDILLTRQTTWNAKGIWFWIVPDGESIWSTARSVGRWPKRYHVWNHMFSDIIPLFISPALS